jgi:hypothetical protein
VQEAKIKSWIVDRLTEGKFQGAMGFYYYLALFIRSAWNGFNGA